MASFLDRLFRFPIFPLWEVSGFPPSTAIISDTYRHGTFETKVVTRFTKRLISNDL